MIATAGFGSPKVVPTSPATVSRFVEHLLTQKPIGDPSDEC